MRPASIFRFVCCSSVLAAGAAAQEPPAAAAATVFVGDAAAPGEGLALWSRRPAQLFVEAYPLGDGRLGATWFGGVGVDRVVLNEISMWSGRPQNADRVGAAANLPRIVALLREGKNGEAEQLVNRTFTCEGKGSGHGNGKDVPFGCYQTLGELEVTVLGKDGAPLAGEVRDYRRVLDLSLAPAEQQVTFVDAEGRPHERRLRCDSAVMLQYAAGGAPLDLRVSLRRRERAAVQIEDGRLVLRGALADGDGGDGVRFAANVDVSTDGGSVTAREHGLQVRGAKTVWIVASAATDFAGLGAPRTSDAPPPESRLPAAPPPGAAFRSTPADDNSGAQLDLGGHARRAVPTLERLLSVAQGIHDPDLFATYFRLADHLLRGSSIEGGLPANLQGLWAPEYQTPWNGDYHLNINVQMNYWAALVTGRFANHLPLIDLVESLVQNGTKTAAAYYQAPGFVAHTITNVWGYTSPGEHASWGSSNTCSGWLCRHLFEHWAYTQERAFLQRVYPMLAAAARFYRHVLVAEPRHGWLVTPVSNSPENAFRLLDGSVAHVCMGPTIDQQIVRELFTNVVEAAQVLGVDGELAADLAAAAAKLAPHQIGKHGQLQEWLDDYDEPEPHHRHVSHLYGLYPGDQITPFGTPALAQAARVSLERRGDDGTGWSLAWKANLWARLGDGDRALALLKRLLSPVGVPGFAGGHGGSYANLLCAHPPFQIDGNFGGAAAIAEMLLQSHREAPGEPFTIHLLPALPRAWSTGRVQGLFARGNVEVQDLRWQDGRLVAATLQNRGPLPRVVRLRTRAAVTVRVGEASIGEASVGDEVAPSVLEFTLPARALARIEPR